jgi:enediyne biosynthesis protein E4
MGPEFQYPVVARGAAYGDFDHDGDLDVLMSTNGGPARLFRNDGGNRNHWLQLKLTGVESNRSALGAVVRIESASGAQTQTVHSGSSYCSQSDLGLTFGLGKDEIVKQVDILWPSGRKDRLVNLKTNQRLPIREGQK